jgi:hypothetical protein
MNLLKGLQAFSELNILLQLLYLGIFLFIVREVLTWYFKIDKIEELLKKIEENTRKSTQKDADLNLKSEMKSL